jgi:hypothetical protein
MANTIELPNLKFFQWQRPNAANPRLSVPLNLNDDEVEVSSPPLDENGDVITGDFIFGVRNSAGYVENIYVPPGEVSTDGLTFTNVVRGINTTGLDYNTTVPELVAEHGQDSPVFCNVTAVYESILAACLRGQSVRTNGLNFILGTGSAETVTVSRDDGTVRGWLRFDDGTQNVQFSNDGSAWVNLSPGGGNSLIAITAADTSPGYLDDKLDVTSNNSVLSVQKNVLNPGGGEILELEYDVDSTNTSSGVGDAGKLVELDAGGKIDNTMIDVAKVEVFTSNGTWTKPPNAKFVKVICYGAGGGGAGGRGNTAGIARLGGGGGGGGSMTEKWFRASDLGGTVAVTVGSGGAGGAGSSSGAGSVNGAGGGNSSFGALITAYGGGGGQQASNDPRSGGSGGGTAGAGVIGTSGNTLGGLPASVAGANGIAGQGAGGVLNNCAFAEYGGGSGGGVTTSGNNIAPGGGSIFAGGGGGSGGGVNSSNTATAGLAGGSHGVYAAGGGGAGGNITGSAGSNGTSRIGFGAGDGGGGGGSSPAVPGGNGGDGGSPAGGGGGGGAGTNGGGTGGNGGSGLVIVYTWS